MANNSNITQLLCLLKKLKYYTVLYIFKKKSEEDKLNTAYKKLLKEAYILSTSNRKESDKKHEEADNVLKKIEALKKP